MTTSPFLTIDQLLERWQNKISRGRLAQWRMDSCEYKGPDFIRMGRTILYPLDAVERFEQDHLSVGRR